MSKIGIKFVSGGRVFTVDCDKEYNDGDNVVIESVRGLELAIVCRTTKQENDEEIKSIVRLATTEDLEKAEELKKQSPRVVDITNDLIKKYKLEMKLVDVSFTLDGTKVIINYVCEDRVDFRELVKDLASILKLRIELRQIGIRDQAKIIGGIGFCGKECCCKKYLNDFDKVSIKMAKTQGLSLNPTKISGICGRLMCCLSYENEFYSEISTKMPKLNSKVKTKDGLGTVVYNNILKQMVTVRVENDNEIKVGEYSLSDIEFAPKTQPEKNEQKDQPKPEKTTNETKKESVENKQTDCKTDDNKKKNNNKKHKFNKKKNFKDKQNDSKK